MTGLIFYMHDGPKAFRFELSGSLAGADVARIQQAWRTASSTLGNRLLAVDMTFLKSADERGRNLLMEWRDLGARFIANSPASRAIVESVTGHPYISRDADIGPTFYPHFTAGAFRGAVVALIATITMVFPSKALAATLPDAAVLERYDASLQSNSRFDRQNTVVEIDASLPRLEKQARVEAIRKISDGRPHYQYVVVEGDSFVRNEMIARYFALGSQNAPAVVPITKSNYRFRFVTTQGTDSVYQITPRRKRQGMIAGVLWIDTESGQVTHIAGRMVKSPSVFLRRVDISQNMEVREGVTQSRVTHLHIETRFTGGAEINIRERAYAGAEVAEYVAQ